MKKINRLKLEQAKMQYLTTDITLRQAARNEGQCPFKFKEFLEDLNIPIKVYHNRKYFFDENIFEEIDTEEKAYWLGFLYADGSIYDTTCCEFAQSASSVDHLRKFKSFIGAEYPLREKHIGKYKAYVYQINSKIFVNHLIDKGCVPRK